MSLDSMFFRTWKHDIIFSLSCGSDFIFRSFNIITYDVEQYILKEKEILSTDLYVNYQKNSILGMFLGSLYDPGSYDNKPLSY